MEDKKGNLKLEYAAPGALKQAKPYDDLIILIVIVFAGASLFTIVTFLWPK